MQMFTNPDRSTALPFDLGVQFAIREVAALIEQLEPDLTPRQSTLLHQLRLAAESLGAARAWSSFRAA
jgi:hypothetical protein